MSSRRGKKPIGEDVRFWSKVEWTPGCWFWTGARTSTGYGNFMVDGRRWVKAHRWAYERLIGAIPWGLELDHLCRVRHCVNVAHLEPVTHRENGIRGIGPQSRARHTHCKRGHAYAIHGQRRSDGRRRCGECVRLRGVRSPLEHPVLLGLLGDLERRENL